jgi:hypothetical protein
MRRRKRYSLAYLLVLLAAIGGFFLVRDRARAIEPPTVALPTGVQQALTELDLFGLFGRLIPAVIPATTPTPLIPVRTPEPEVVQGIESPATPDSPAAMLPPPTPAAVQSAISSADAAPPFTLVGAVRHSFDDCQGASILGSVRDATGAPLAGVRLWRYDQWGNEDVGESGAGDTDRGRYVLSIDDTPNVHYIQVIDAGGVIISPVLEIQHRQGEAADAVCHWLDWQQQ